jgi:hypothetical protein
MNMDDWFLSYSISFIVMHAVDQSGHSSPHVPQSQEVAAGMPGKYHGTALYMFHKAKKWLPPCQVNFSTGGVDQHW